jgi:MFS family permease
MVPLILLDLWDLYEIMFPDITNSAIVAMTLSIFFLSFALGPMIFGPLSEMYGRTWVNDIQLPLYP